MEATQKRLGVVSAVLGAIKEPLTILMVFGAILLNIFIFDEPVGAILLSLILLYRAIVFFMALQEQWNSFLGFSGSLENMLAFEKELISGAEENGSEVFEGFQDKMELRDLSFEFEKGSKVLNSLDLDIYKNQTLAIVGESGAGKSTLVNIIGGLLMPTEGQVLIDGKSIKDLNLSTYRKDLGYIVQDAVIFNDTIYNNISFWAPKTEENYQRFLRAAKRAAIFDFINDLPKGENTELGFNGINISGGQKQRISIARELFKEVSFLFMDEATSSLDGETESIIQQNIFKLKGHYTIIIIAHRLATIKNADNIILMKGGRILETGTFDMLMKSSEEFQNMVLLQNL
jgi:subfamily B ATP-binding cassette protein MsbA